MIQLYSLLCISVSLSWKAISACWIESKIAWQHLQSFHGGHGCQMHDVRPHQRHMAKSGPSWQCRTCACWWRAVPGLLPSCFCVLWWPSSYARATRYKEFSNEHQKRSKEKVDWNRLVGRRRYLAILISCYRYLFKVVGGHRGRQDEYATVCSVCLRGLADHLCVREKENKKRRMMELEI